MTNADESPSRYVMCCVTEIEKLIIPFGSAIQPAEFVFPQRLSAQDRHAVICSFLLGCRGCMQQELKASANAAGDIYVFRVCVYRSLYSPTKGER